MNKKFKILFKDTLIFALGSLGSKVILFFLVPLYTNFLTTEEYGIADLVFTTSQLIIPIVSIVIYEAVIRFGLTKDQNPAEVLKVGLTIGALGTLLTVATTPLFGFYSPISPWKWYLCVYVVLNFTSNILMSYLKVKDRNKRYAIISVTRTLIMALLNILLLAVLKTGVRGYLIANICASAICVVLAATAGNAISDFTSASFNRTLCGEMIRYAVPLILNDLSWWVIHSSDKFMIEAMVSASALGLYTVATKIPSLINVMISIFGQAWGISSIREIESSNDTRFYSTVLKGYMFITFGACVFLVSIIKPFMTIYVGKDFQTAWTFVPILLVSAVFSSISSYYGQLYGALKKSVNSMVTTLSAAVINIIVNYILIQKMGVWGAVIGTVSAYICLVIMRMFDVKRYIGIDIDYTRLIINCAIIIAQGILVSQNFHIVIVSILSITLFAAVNYSTAREYVGSIKKNS
jgi:O-antigen/teichoic acid export membrane protein